MLLKDIFDILDFDPQLIDRYIVKAIGVYEEYDNLLFKYDFGEKEVEEIEVLEDEDTGYGHVYITLKDDENCLDEIFN